MCHFASPSLTPYPVILVESRIFNMWTSSHGTPYSEESWIIIRASCEKFKVLTNSNGTPLLKITLARISCFWSETVRLHEVRYEVCTRSIQGQPILLSRSSPLGLGCVCTQTAVPPLTVHCQLWRGIHVGIHRLRLAAIWLRAALWRRGMHLVFYLRRS